MKKKLKKKFLKLLTKNNFTCLLIRAILIYNSFLPFWNSQIRALQQRKDAFKPKQWNDVFHRTPRLTVEIGVLNVVAQFTCPLLNWSKVQKKIYHPTNSCHIKF